MAGGRHLIERARRASAAPPAAPALALVAITVLALAGALAAAAQTSDSPPPPPPAAPSRTAPATPAGAEAAAHRAPAADEGRGYDVPPGRLLVLPEGAPPRAVPFLTLDNQPYLAAADVGGILHATSYWRPETRKLLFRTGSHRVRLAVDNPFVIIDDMPHRIPAPRYRSGRVWIPLRFFDLASRVGLVGAVQWNGASRLLSFGSGGTSIGAIRLEEEGDVTRLSVQVAAGIRAQVISDSQDLFTVRLQRGVAPPSLLGMVQTLGRFEQIEVVQGEEGVTLFMRVSQHSRGYALRAVSDPQRIEILVADSWGRQQDLVFQPFEFEIEEEVELPDANEPGGKDDRAARAAPADRTWLVVVDPGHGGEDEGTTGADGQKEKHLNLELARRLKRHLESGGGDTHGGTDGGGADAHRLRAALVRDRDERVDVPRRVEIANGMRADLLVSVHSDLNGPLARGGFVVVVRSGGAAGGGQVEYADMAPIMPGTITTTSDEAEVLSLVRWESVGSQHALASRHVARRIADALADRFPAAGGTVAIRPAWSLEGARMPAVLVEIGALEGWQNMDPGAAINRASYLDAVAAVIATAIKDALWDLERGTSAAGGVETIPGERANGSG